MIADGMDFEFAKASQGTWFTDDYFARNRARAAQAGLLFGAYHFLEKGDGAVQADAFFQRLQDTGGVTGVMLMVDVEWPGEAETNGPSYVDVTDFCARFTNWCRTVRSCFTRWLVLGEDRRSVRCVTRPPPRAPC